VGVSPAATVSGREMGGVFAALTREMGAPPAAASGREIGGAACCCAREGDGGGGVRSLLRRGRSCC
jgi:hypothetical protein